MLLKGSNGTSYLRTMAARSSSRAAIKTCELLSHAGAGVPIIQPWLIRPAITGSSGRSGMQAMARFSSRATKGIICKTIPRDLTKAPMAAIRSPASMARDWKRQRPTGPSLTRVAMLSNVRDLAKSCRAKIIPTKVPYHLAQGRAKLKPLAAGGVTNAKHTGIEQSNASITRRIWVKVAGATILQTIVRTLIAPPTVAGAVTLPMRISIAGQLVKRKTQSSARRSGDPTSRRLDETLLGDHRALSSIDVAKEAPLSCTFCPLSGRLLPWRHFALQQLEF